MENGFGGGGRVEAEMEWRSLWYVRRQTRASLDEHAALWCPDLGVAICEHGWQVWEQKSNTLRGMEEKKLRSQVAWLSSWTNTNRCLIRTAYLRKTNLSLWKQQQSDFQLLVANELSTNITTILCQPLVLGGSRNKKYCIPALRKIFSLFLELRNLHSKLKKTNIFQCLTEA